MAAKKKKAPIDGRDPLRKDFSPEMMRQRIVALVDDIARVKKECEAEGYEDWTGSHVYLNGRADVMIGNVLPVLEHIGVDVSAFK